MSLLRTSRSLIPRRSVAQSQSQSRSQFLIFTRTFHIPPPLNAQGPRSPRVKVVNQYKKTNASINKRTPTYNVEDSLPPSSLLESAKEEGVLEIDIEKALLFLRAFALSHSTRSTGTWEEKLCADYQITPLNLCQLSYSMTPPDGAVTPLVLALAKPLMMASSSLGCKEATCAIIHSGVINKREISHLHDTTKHLKQLAEEGDKQAMTLLGMVFMNQKKNEEALSWFCAAVGWIVPDPQTTKGMDAYEAPPQPTQDIEFDGANEALLGIGQLLMKLHPDPVIIAQAHQAFRIAALELDDPAAYFYLAKLTADQTQREANTLTSEETSTQCNLMQYYLEKAAASGIPAAWSMLFRSSSIQLQRQQQEGASSDLDMAKEWVLFGKEFADFEAIQGR